MFLQLNTNEVVNQMNKDFVNWVNEMTEKGLIKYPLTQSAWVVLEAMHKLITVYKNVNEEIL
jgi:hypothetical protein